MRPHVHPTLYETIGLAAEVFEGTATDDFASAKAKKKYELIGQRI